MIEFINGEEYCRWNNVQMTDEENLKLFGGVFVDNHGDIWYINDLIYIEADTLQEAFIKFISFESYANTEYSYDNALDEAHGFSKKTTGYILSVNNDLFKDIKKIRLIKESPETSNFNFELMLQFQTDLNNYYNNKYDKTSS